MEYQYQASSSMGIVPTLFMLLVVAVIIAGVWKVFVKAGKPVAAICHGPWILADAGVLKGRKVTSVPTIRKDIENAGAHWVDEEVVVDNGIVTSRTPKDLAAFNAKLIEEIGEGRHERRAA